MKKYSPIATNGIPVLEPNSSSYSDFWKEQIHFCKNGYQPKGLPKIPGRYYFYLNFCKITKIDKATRRKALIHPLYRDMDHEFYNTIELAYETEKGIILVKGRDKGFTAMGSANILYEYTLFPNNEVGVGAATNPYLDKFRSFMDTMRFNLPSELQKTNALDQPDRLYHKFKIRANNQRMDTGTLSAVHFRCIDNPDAFRGERMKMVWFDEAGEIKELLRTVMATDACFMEGSVRWGIPVIGGTSNNLKAGNEDFRKMYQNAEAFNLIPVFIPASKVMFGFLNEKTGKSDEEGATKKILDNRENLKKAGSMEALYLNMQEHPLSVDEAFTLANRGTLPLYKINEQRSRLIQEAGLKDIVKCYDLEWVDSKTKKEVKCTPNPFGKFKILHHPNPALKNLDISGIDSYDQDESSTDSLGACCIYRRFSDVNIPGDLPVATYLDRPQKAEDFYDGCLKLSVYYDAKTLIEYTKIRIIDYFKNNNGLKYLKERPESADAKYSVATNKYGVVMSGVQKTLQTDLLVEYLHVLNTNIFFIDLLEQLAFYGAKNADLADAFGLCLIHNRDIHKIVVKQKDEEKKGYFGIPVYQHDGSGRLIKTLR